jgi:hypothetical protein
VKPTNLTARITARRALIEAHEVPASLRALDATDYDHRDYSKPLEQCPGCKSPRWWDDMNTCLRCNHQWEPRTKQKPKGER